MKITFINARGNDSQIAPFGLMYIAAVLEREGHKVKIFDPLPQDYSFVNKIKNIDMIGLSFLTTEYHRAKKIASLIKNKAKYFVVGGVHITAMPKRTIKELNADFGIIGEGEYTMKELVEKLEKGKKIDKIKGLAWRKNKKIIINGRRKLIENLDELPFPARHLLNYEWYLRPPGGIRGYYLKGVGRILTARGCPYNCIFCGSHKIFGRKVRKRSVKSVIEEIKFLKKKYDIKGVSFLDDTLTLDYKWLEEFCKEIKKLNLIWACQSRVDRIKEDILEKMKDAGCVQLDFGVESGSNKVLNALRKGTTTEMQKKAFEITKKVGLNALATIMIGNPEEKKEDIELTRKQLLRLKPDFVHVFYITPFPGSDLYDIAIKNNWIKDKNFSENWDIRRAEKPVMEINFSANELIKLRKSLQNSFLFNNYKAYLKNPLMIGKVLISYLTNKKNLIESIKRFSKSRRADDLVEGALKSYRLKNKK